MSPDKSVIPSRRRVQIACSIASSTNGVVIVVAVRHPRILREYASMTNETYTQPDHVETYVKSATHNMFGATGLNFRCTRSSARPPCGSAMVVRFFLPRRAPSSPRTPINRSTVHRATSTPSRRISSHTLRAP